MSLGRALDRALDGAQPGVVSAEVEGRRVEAVVVDVDRLGVRLGRVKVSREADYPVETIGQEWPDRLRSLPERVAPVEVDPGLGGAVFRSEPDDEQGWFEVEVRGADAEVGRRRRGAEGREAVEFTLTREGLRRLVDELA